MKQFKVFIGILLLSAGAVGCSSTFRAATGYASDDLYAVHDRAEIARRQQAEAEAQRAAAEARKAEWEARIAEAEAAAAENRYYEYTSPDANPYESILADDYESAYARRLRGFESPTYKMPSSYLDARYSSAFTYASAYDPAFYNIIISGDQVWVEPKYITSMFGTWGGTVLWDPWYYGWTRPWGPSFAFGSWGWSVGWNAWYNPWYYGWYGSWGPWYASWYDPWWGPAWGWGPGWYGHHHHYWGGGHGSSRPYYGSMVRRPNPYTSPSGQRYGSGLRYGTAPSDASPSRGTGGKRSYFGIRNNNGSGNYDNSSRSYRNSGNSWNNNYNRGSNSFDRGSSSSFNRGSSPSFGGGGGGAGTRPSGGSSRNAGGR